MHKIPLAKETKCLAVQILSASYIILKEIIMEKEMMNYECPVNFHNLGD